ncbi:MAG: hypothetical protein AVDCRST_MAG36-1313, partial [uncultured Nocardioidaceae bacterium]
AAWVLVPHGRLARPRRRAVPGRSGGGGVRRAPPRGRRSTRAPCRCYGLSRGPRLRRRLPGHPELLRRGGLPAVRVRRAPGAAAPRHSSRAPPGRPELVAGHGGRRDCAGATPRVGDLDVRRPRRRGPRPRKAGCRRRPTGQGRHPV